MVPQTVSELSPPMPARRALQSVALLLVFAAVAKSLQVWRDPHENLLLIPEVIFELFLAGWFTSGFHPRRALQIALATFTLFAIVSLIKVYLGKSSCGCFGPLQVPPAVTFFIDLGILILLMLQTAEESFFGPTFFRRLLRTTCLLCVGFAAFTIAWHQHQEQSPHPVEIFPSDLKSSH